MTREDYQQAAQDLRSAIAPRHLTFLKSLWTSVPIGNYFLCHAGVRPGVALDCQNEHDLLWIGEEFLASRADFGKIVVHGHSPTESPQVLPNRINIDTGAFMTGRLTCAVLDQGSLRFLSTK